MKKIVSKQIWISKESLNDLIGDNWPCSSLNMNLFNKNPELTSYDCHKPVQIKIDIYGAENVGF